MLTAGTVTESTVSNFSCGLIKSLCIKKMLVKLTLGFAAFAVILVLFAVVSSRRAAQNEGFHNGDAVSPSLFVAKVTPGGAEEASDLSPGAAMDTGTEAILESGKLKAMPVAQARANLGEMTSQACYRADIGESLKKTRNYLQRTNNYQRTHPDSCSAPNHEFVGTFYTPFDGVGRTPASGADYPPSTQYCME